MTKEIVLLRSWGGAVVGQSEVALSCDKGGRGMQRCLGMWVQIYEVEYSFFIASEKPVIHEAYFTSQSSATVRQITSESPLHPGKPSSSNTRM